MCASNAPEISSETSRASVSAQATNEEPGLSGAEKSVQRESERPADGAVAAAAATGSAPSSVPPMRIGSTLVSVAPPLTVGATSKR